MDETSLKIVDTAMHLFMKLGYASTTTKEIAKAAGVNECTIFRKFKGKKDIVMQAMRMDKWNPDLRIEDFMGCQWELETDLVHFSTVYMKKVTPEFVKISIGLRTPELFECTADGIMRVPQVFLHGVKKYFEQMVQRKKLNETVDTEHLAMMFLTINFGFVFLKASFGNKLTTITEEEYIRKSVQMFINGIE